MTNEELNAKVAAARGEFCKHNKEGLCFVNNWHQPECGGIPCIWAIPKPYATDMNAAWELKHEMLENGVGKIEVENYYTKKHFVNIYSMSSDIFCVSGSTEERAICNAYLKFKGV